MRYIFENEQLDQQVLVDFENFIDEVLDDPKATLDKYYYSYNKLCRRIDRVAKHRDAEDYEGLDYSKRGIEAMLTTYEIPGVIDYDAETNELLAYSMVYNLRRQLYTSRNSGNQDLYRFLSDLEEEIWEGIKGGSGIRGKGYMAESRNIEYDCDYSYFGDPDLDSEDKPDSIINKREREKERNYGNNDGPWQDYDNTPYRKAARKRALEYFKDNILAPLVGADEIYVNKYGDDYYAYISDLIRNFSEKAAEQRQFKNLFKVHGEHYNLGDRLRTIIIIPQVTYNYERFDKYSKYKNSVDLYCKMSHICFIANKKIDEAIKKIDRAGIDPIDPTTSGPNPKYTKLVKNLIIGSAQIIAKELDTLMAEPDFEEKYARKDEE